MIAGQYGETLRQGWRVLGAGLTGVFMVWGGLHWNALAVSRDDLPRVATAIAQASSQPTQGETITIGGTSAAIPWQRRGDRIGLADLSLMQVLGVDLGNTNTPTQQPVLWFSETGTPLTTWYANGYRYVDVTDWAAQQGWQLRTTGTALTIQPPPAQVLAGRRGRQTWGDRLVLDMDRPALWTLNEDLGQFTLTLHTQTAATFSPLALVQAQGNLLRNVEVRQSGNQLIIQATYPESARPRVWSLTNPNRVVIDVRQDDLLPRDIAWAPGLRWQARYVTVGGRAFPVSMLRLRASQGAKARPVWANPQSAAGIGSLRDMVRNSGAVAGINAGFFNRNNQLPLGAVRRDGRWISGPILNRGAIAWNEQGGALINRLFLGYTLTTGEGRNFPVGPINSGYVQAGIGLYTPDWGSYSPILDNETLVSVSQNRVLRQDPGGAAASRTTAIPRDGYLLAVRALSEAVRSLPPGTTLRLTPDLRPAAFEPFPHVIGGGPLLVKDRQVVLSAATEGFSDAFATQAAPRSAIGLTSEGDMLLVAIHFSPGGRGPTLAETAQIMLQLGSVDALNLDGGSSSGLMLGGQMLNRHPRTIGRIHNAIGVFWGP